MITHVDIPRARALARRTSGDLAAPRVYVTAYASPFHTRADARWFPAGLSIDEGLAAIGLKRYEGCKTVVWLNDHPIPMAWWGLVRPKPHAAMTVRVIPQGGNGRLIGTILITIAAIAATVVTAGLATPGLVALYGILYGTILAGGIGAVAGAAVSPATSLKIMALPLQLGEGNRLGCL